MISPAASASPDTLITHHVTLPLVIRDARLHISNKSQDLLPGDNRQWSLDIDHSLNTKWMLSSQISKVGILVNSTWEQWLWTQVAYVVKIQSNHKTERRLTWEERMYPGLAFRLTMGDRRLVGHILIFCHDSHCHDCHAENISKYLPCVQILWTLLKHSKQYVKVPQSENRSNICNYTK